MIGIFCAPLKQFVRSRTFFGESQLDFKLKNVLELF